MTDKTKREKQALTQANKPSTESTKEVASKINGTDSEASILVFPCEIDVKIFIKSDTRHQAVVRKFVEDALEPEQLKSWTLRDSKNGKYLAITAVVFAHSREQIDDLYQQLGELDQVIMMI